MAILDVVGGSAQYGPVDITTRVVREDLWEMVTIVDPYDTPLVSMLPRRDVQSVVHQWICDTLPAMVENNTSGTIDVSGVNTQGVLDNFDLLGAGASLISFTSFASAPERLTNFVQIFATRIGVQDSLKGMGTIMGIKDPYNYEIAKHSKTLGKAIERRLLDNISANANFMAATSGAAATPRRMKALFEWTTGNFQINQTTVGATGGSLTADAVDANAEKVLKAGGKPEYLLLGVGTKFDLSINLRQSAQGQATVINTSNIGAQEKRVIRNVDFYDGDGGTFAMLVSKQVPENSGTASGGKAWLLERGKLAIGQYVPVHHIPLAKTGYNTKGVLVGELTTEVLNPKAIGVINNVTT